MGSSRGLSNEGVLKEGPPLLTTPPLIGLSPVISGTNLPIMPKVGTSANFAQNWPKGQIRPGESSHPGPETRPKMAQTERRPISGTKSVKPWISIQIWHGRVSTEFDEVQTDFGPTSGAVGGGGVMMLERCMGIDANSLSRRRFWLKPFGARFSSVCVSVIGCLAAPVVIRVP